MKYWFKLLTSVPVLLVWLIKAKWKQGNYHLKLDGSWNGPVPKWTSQYVAGTKCSWFKFTLAHLYALAHLKYEAEPKGQDYWKQPEEAIQDGVGDCEDFASVMVSEGQRLGLRIGWLYIYNGSLGHILAAVLNNDEIVWVADNNQQLPERPQILTESWPEYKPVAWFDGKEKHGLKEQYR